MKDHDHQANGHPKYLGEIESSARLFGVLNLSVDTEVMAICEGELDTIVCTAAGIPAVGISGSNKWRPWWAHCFEGYAEVVVLQDGDENGAGEKLSKTVSANLYNTTSRTVPMPRGHDVNSYVLEFGPQALRERIGL
jgi:DNA primase